MEPLTVAQFVALVTFVGALGGIWTPDRHADADSRDVVKLAMGLGATMTALILGSVVSWRRNGSTPRTPTSSKVRPTC
jgi:hypothetical protein